MTNSNSKKMIRTTPENLFQFFQCIECFHLTQFINDNSDMEWAHIQEMEKQFGLFVKDETHNHVVYNENLDMNDPKDNLHFMKYMINCFYETYELDKKKPLILIKNDYE